MRQLAIIVSSAFFLMGCSFRAPVPTPGEILSLQVLASGVNTPFRIKAQVEFTGASDSPTLAVVHGAQGDTIQLTAFAQPAQPLLGMGVIPVDRTLKHTIEVENTFVISKAGTYRVNGLSGLDRRVTATTTLNIE